MSRSSDSKDTERRAGNLEKLVFTQIRVELWIVFLTIVGSLGLATLTASLVKYRLAGGKRLSALTKVIDTLASYPQIVWSLRNPTTALQPQLLQTERAAGLIRYDSDFEETGSLLVASYIPEHDAAGAYLLDLKSGKKLCEWLPPAKQILEQTSFAYPITARSLEVHHPWPLNDGGVMFICGDGPLARIDRQSRLVWTANRFFHHSLQKGPEGTFFAPYVVGPSPPLNPEGELNDGYPVTPIRDEGVAEITQDGDILKEWPLHQLLLDNGYAGLLYGVGQFEADLFHINDVEPVWKTDDHAQRGDLFISCRHLSTVFQFRPSSGKIVWSQTGPWLNQHDVDYHGNGIITVFGNNVVRQPTSGTPLAGVRCMPRLIPFTSGNIIYETDIAKGTTVPKWDLSDHDIFTQTQGLHTVLSNGDVFVEETDSGFLYRIRADNSGIRWVYSTHCRDGYVGAMHWSRYLPATTEEGTELPGLPDILNSVRPTKGT